MAVAGDLHGVAPAFALGVAVVAAGTRVHGGDEQESGREGHAAGGAGDGDLAVLQGLAHHFQGGAVEFGEFVQKKDTVVGDGDFARGGMGAAAQQTGVGNGMVGGAEGAVGEDGLFGVEQAADAMDAGGFDGFLAGEGRHDGGHALGEHAFPGARGPYHEEIVPAGGGDFEGTLDAVLAFDVGTVDLVSLMPAEFLDGAGAGGEEGFFAAEVVEGIAEAGDADDADASDDAGFLGIVGGDDDFLTALSAGRKGDGEDTFHRADAAIEGEFANNRAAVKDGAVEVIDAVGDHPQRHREVKAGAFFFEVGWRQINRGAAAGGAGEGGVGDGGPDAVAAFADGGIGEADDDGDGLHLPAGVGGAGFVDFEFDFDGVDAAEGGRVDSGEFAGHGVGYRKMVGGREGRMRDV